MQKQIQQTLPASTQSRLKRKRRFSLSILLFSFLFSILIIIFLWSRWSSVYVLWQKTIWLQWLTIGSVTFLTLISTFLWILKSKGSTRRLHSIIVVLVSIAIGVALWLLSAFHLIPDAIGLIISIIFIGVGLAFTFLQWTVPLSPMQAKQSNVQNMPLQSPQHSSLAPQSVSTCQQAAPQDLSVSGSTQTGNSSLKASSTQNKAADYLISYVDTDSEWALWIDAQLQGENCSTILSEYDLRVPGKRFLQELNTATSNAKQTLLVLSPDYVLGERLEWQVALKKAIEDNTCILIPVYVCDCPEQLKGLLGTITPINLIGKRDADARETLLIGLGLHKRSTTPPRFPGTT